MTRRVALPIAVLLLVATPVAATAAGVPFRAAQAMWREIVGDHGKIVSIDHYGASADYARIYQEFGLTGEAVANAARDSLRLVTD